MKKSLLCLGGLFLLVVKLTSQELPRFAPPSPEVASFLRVENIKVNEFTGKPNISIPIITKQYRGYPISINLIYNPDGLKVESESSWVGNGWTLSYGGYINREVNEMPDEERFRVYLGQQYSGTYNSCQRLKIEERTSFIENNQEIYELANYFKIHGNLSGYTGNITFLKEQPDLFNYHLPNGINGKFVFDNLSSGVTEVTDSNGFKVEFLIENYSLKSFNITDFEGYEYFFDETEKSSINERDYNLLTSNPQTGTISNPLYTLAGYTSSNFLNTCNESEGFSDIGSHNLYTKKYNHTWHLKKIIPVNGNPITFEYDSLYHKSLSSLESNYGRSPYGGYRYTYRNYYKEYNLKVVKRINWTEGSIEFITDNIKRLDVDNQSELKALREIRLNNNEGLVKKITFNTSYNEAKNITVVNLESEKIFYRRLWLDSLTINDHSVNPLNYSFLYNEGLLPNRVSFEQDYWGYYNGNNSDSDNKIQLPNLWFYPDDSFSYSKLVPTSIFKRLNYIGREYRLNDNLPTDIESSTSFNNNNPSLFSNRESNITYALHGVLERIVYPTGASTELEYELNDFYIEGKKIEGNGLRVFKQYLKNFNIIESETIYEYLDENGLSSGKVFAYPAFGRISNFSSKPFNTHEDFNVYYEFVTKKTINKGKVITKYNIPIDINTENGFWSDFHQDYFYQKNFNISNINSENQNIFYVPNIDISITHNLAQILGKEIFKEIYDDSNFLISRVANEYEFSKESKKIFFLKPDPNGSSIINAYNSDNLKQLQTVILSDLLLRKTTQEVFFNSGQVINKVNEFKYNNYDLIKEEIQTDSKGNILKSNYFYADDVISASSLGNINLSTTEFNAINRLKINDQHRQSEIIQTNQYKNNTLIHSVRNIYKDWGQNIVLLEKIQTAKGIETLEDRLIYSSYTDNGNPLEVSKKDGTKIYYVWGYNDMYPIAKINGYTGFSPSQQNLINQAISYSNADHNQATEEALYEKLELLRGGFPDSMVETYTYNPLVGVTSITNPRGNTIYYYYDDFNRLIMTKDVDGNILEEFKYNYKNSFSSNNSNNSNNTPSFSSAVVPNNYFSPIPPDTGNSSICYTGSVFTKSVQLDSTFPGVGSQIEIDGVAATQSWVASKWGNDYSSGIRWIRFFSYNNTVIYNVNPSTGIITGVSNFTCN